MNLERGEHNQEKQQTKEASRRKMLQYENNLKLQNQELDKLDRERMMMKFYNLRFDAQ